MSYIVHGGPLAWALIAAATAAVLAGAWFTRRNWHHGPLPRHAAPHSPGGGVSPRAAAGSAPGDRRLPRGASAGKTGSRGTAPSPAAGSGVPGGGDAGDFPAGPDPDLYLTAPLARQGVWEPRSGLDTAEMRAVAYDSLAYCPDCGEDHPGECDGTWTTAARTFLPAPMTRQPEPPPVSDWSPPRVVRDVPAGLPWEQPACGLCGSPGHETTGHDQYTATARQADAATRQASVLLAGVMLWARMQHDRPPPALTLGSLDHLERRLWTSETDTFAAICGTDGGGNG